MRDKIPQFYFPRGSCHDPDIIESEEKILNRYFTKDLTVDEFTPITVELAGFPKMLNSVLFNKITQGKTKLSKADYIK